MYEPRPETKVEPSAQKDEESVYKPRESGKKAKSEAPAEEPAQASGEEPQNEENENSATATESDWGAP